MAKFKLTYTHSDKNNCIAEYIDKRDSRSLPSTFMARVVYFPETETDTQTYSVELEVRLNHGVESVGNSVIQDEFDTMKEAKKWIEGKFKEFKDIICE